MAPVTIATRPLWSGMSAAVQLVLIDPLGREPVTVLRRDCVAAHEHAARRGRRERLPKRSGGSITGASWSCQPAFGRMIQRAIRTRSPSTRSTRSSSRKSPVRPGLVP